MNRMIGAFVAVGIAIGIYAVYFFHDSPEKEIERLTRQIEVDLPHGVRRAEVEKWLRDREMEFHAQLRDDNTPALLSDRIRRKYFWHWSGYLNITFSFDKTDRLTKYAISWTELAL